MRLLLLITSVLVITGCRLYTSGPIEDRRSYATAYRQNAPEPVYNRVRTVRPPEPLPERQSDTSRYPVQAPAKIVAIHSLNLKNATLEEAAQALAQSARYTYYCSSFVAKKRITFNGTGTVEDLAKAIEAKAEVLVTVDNEIREIRFVSKRDSVN